MISHAKPGEKSFQRLLSLARAKSNQIAAPQAQGKRSSEVRAGICATLARGKGVNSRREGRGCKSTKYQREKAIGTLSPVTIPSPMPIQVEGYGHG